MAHRNNPRGVRRDANSRENTRFLEIPTATDNDLNPIEGFLEVPIQSLENAVEHVREVVHDVKIHAQRAENVYRSSSIDGLSSAQSAAIRLYTMEWEPHEKCLYFVLNQALRNKDRTKLKRWFPYLKLVLTGLFQIESVATTVYRGVNLDLHQEYPKGKTIVWWAFSSCTLSLDLIESDTFVGKKGPRTIFIIKCSTGKNISKYSRFSGEAEVLLLPATKLIVTGLTNPAPNFYLIELTEVPSVHMLLVDYFVDVNTPVNSQLDVLFSTSMGNNTLDLNNKMLNDYDVLAVCRKLRSGATWTSVDFSSNMITLDGAKYIRDMLHVNQILKILNLSYNRLTDFGVTSLAHGLECNRTVESITLSSNQVTDRGVEALVYMLDRNRSILYLDLSFNEISDVGVRQLSDLLVRRHYLQQLFLHNNKVGDNSVQNIINMLNANKVLMTLYLHENQLSDDAKDRIRSRTLTSNNLVLSL